ncbi:hypothetical protein VCRA2123O444_40001 [Vibrio crassostreae]|nr:hypothetical protein VCRA2133O452_50001 [Vibrio crassostreae]CAK3454126.1 hypothetical protein VCRA2123O445_50001 [Vibrio crassostreae]CAK3569058.1 hypothetical protein VCRA2126O446_60001 [Vibrio crassostreae]CAK3904407.1 hypothetical protein VCRA2123O444_40001 [Vibrio crassostreae]CAK3937619.1 hypothetical protein VCRA2121O440_50001 [Vibrio crassostreae]
MIKKYAKRGSSIFKFNYATKPLRLPADQPSCFASLFFFYSADDTVLSRAIVQRVSSTSN